MSSEAMLKAMLKALISCSHHDLNIATTTSIVALYDQLQKRELRKPPKAIDKAVKR